MATTENDQRQKELNKSARQDAEANKEREEQTSSHLSAAGILPSDIESLRYRSPSGKPTNLTGAEAEQFAGLLRDGVDEDAALDRIHSGRTVNHSVYKRVPASTSHPATPDPDGPPPTVPYVAREDADPFAPNRNDPSSSLVISDSEDLDREATEEGLQRAQSVQDAHDKVHEVNKGLQGGSGTSEAEAIENSDLTEPQDNADQAGTGDSETDSGQGKQE